MGDAPENLDAVLMALSDPTRRALLDRLSHGPARVTDLAAPFPISLNSISKHIRILERANLVARFRSGREHVLTLNLAPLKSATTWLGQVDGQWAGRLTALDAALSTAG